ncbi:MAG: hypothetical protein HYY96_01165 [Candidatus Tectomicrobia bacterium]|nr:hypothetical protein [Candidatus Tectomicrobia bacterium]
MRSFSARWHGRSVRLALLLGTLFLSGCVAAGAPVALRPLACTPALAPIPEAPGAYIVNDCVVRDWLAGRKAVGGE